MFVKSVKRRFVMTIIEQWRRFKGWTFVELAEKTGLTPSTIGSHCSLEKKLKVQTVNRFSAAFGVTSQEFLAGPPVIGTLGTLSARVEAHPLTVAIENNTDTVPDNPPDKAHNVLGSADSFVTSVDLQTELVGLILKISRMEGGIEKLTVLRDLAKSFCEGLGVGLGERRA